MGLEDAVEISLDAPPNGDREDPRDALDKRLHVAKAFRREALRNAIGLIRLSTNSLCGVNVSMYDTIVSRNMSSFCEISMPLSSIVSGNSPTMKCSLSTVTV
jgi:hypothetical protein